MNVRQIEDKAALVYVLWLRTRVPNIPCEKSDGCRQEKLRFSEKSRDLRH